MSADTRGEPASASLAGHRLQRVDAPEPARTLALTLHGDGARRCLLLVADGAERGGLRLVDDRPRGEAASAFARRLRKELANGRVVEVTAQGPVFRVRLRRGPVERSLVVDLRARDGAIVYLDADDRVLGAPAGRMLRALGLRPGAPWPAPDAPPRPLELQELRGIGDQAADAEVRARGDARGRALRAALRRERKRLERKVAAIEGDARRADEAPALRRRAEALRTSLAAEDRGAGIAWVWDWSAEPPTRESVTLEPGLDAQGQAARWFARAKRYERGAEIAARRGHEARTRLAALRALEAELEEAASLPELEDVAERADAAGVRIPAANAARASARRAVSAPRVPYRAFRGHGAREIRVGRSARDNDALTLRHARPFDLWLHVRGRRGSHVVVPLARTEDCPPELLADAATLAAHFSEARGEEQVEVTYTRRKHVRKPRGFAPGAVRVDRERSLWLRLEPARLRTLLAHESDANP